MATNADRLHCVLRGPPDRIYRTFLDADALLAMLVEAEIPG
jgi:hypothetical protein